MRQVNQRERVTLALISHVTLRYYLQLNIYIVILEDFFHLFLFLFFQYYNNSACGGL